MNREMKSMVDIAKGLSVSKRLKNASLVFSGEGMAVFGASDSFLKGPRFEVRRDVQRWWMVDVVLELGSDLSEESIGKAAHECEVEHDRSAAVSLTVPDNARDVEDAVFLLDQAGVIARSNEAEVRANACCEVFDLVALVKELGYEIEPDDEWYYELNDDQKILASYALPYNLSLLEEALYLTPELEEEIWIGLGWMFICDRRWLFGREILDSLSKRGFSRAQIEHLITQDSELLSSLNTREQALELCGRIERGPFDPENVELWNNYLACEGESLLGFL